ncbi:MAG: SgcJ/EcaC family oxidoreductase [Candidatus Solibacter sp.]
MTAVRMQPEASSCEAVIAGVWRRWNDGRGLEFASYFAEDADLVNVHGMHVRGRQAIAGLYDMLFRSVFLDATVEYQVKGRRDLCQGSTMLHIRVDVNVPYGVMAGEHQASSTLVLQQQSNGWAITSLHNTLINGARTQAVAPEALS